MVRYERNHSFTGRDIFLEQLHNKFHHSTDHYHGRIALFGLGGIGKSEIALEYVYRYQSSYQRIYWISADTQASLLGGYKKIAERAELQTVHLSTRAEIAEDVISWLEQEESWLLVVDNLDNIEVLSMPEKPNSKFLLLPSTGQLRQHTLITTRNRHASGIPAQGMEVDKFGQQDSLRLLYKSSKITSLSDSTEDQAAARIVEDLDHLPLAIDHAAAYIREVAKKFSAFLTDYTRYRRELLNWTPQRLEAYQYTVATTWRMSFAAISVNNPMAVELLRLLSFLNPDGVFIEFLQDGAKAIPDNLQQIISHRIRLYKALLELEKFSLIKRAVHFEGKDILVIHRLVQTVVKDEMPGSELMGFRTTIVNLCNQAFPEEWNEKTWALCRLYVGQVIGPLMDPGVLEGEKFANIVNVMHRVASFLRDDGNAVDSERLLAQLLEYSKRIFGEEHPDTLTIMGNLAIRFHDQGKMVEAVALQEKVLKKQKEILRAEHPNTLTLMNNLASMYLTQDKMKAATMQEEVLMKFGRIRGSEHTDTLKSMGNLAYMYQVQGKMVEAEALQEKVLEKVEGILGADHPDTLTSMDNLASTYEAQGNIEKAAALQYEVLERRKRILGAEHLDTLRSMESLVRMYLAQGKMEEAMLLAREWREKSSKLRLENATKLKELGNVAFKAQNFDLAVEKYEEVPSGSLGFVDDRD